MTTSWFLSHRIEVDEIYIGQQDGLKTDVSRCHNKLISATQTALRSALMMPAARGARLGVSESL